MWKIIFNILLKFLKVGLIRNFQLQTILYRLYRAKPFLQGYFASKSASGFSILVVRSWTAERVLSWTISRPQNLMLSCSFLSCCPFFYLSRCRSFFIFLAVLLFVVFCSLFHYRCLRINLPYLCASLYRNSIRLYQNSATN